MTVGGLLATGAVLHADMRTTWNDPKVNQLPQNIQQLFLSNAHSGCTWASLLQSTCFTPIKANQTIPGALHVAGSRVTWTMAVGYINFWDMSPGIMQHHRAVFRWQIIHHHLIPTTPLRQWEQVYFGPSTRAEQQWLRDHLDNLVSDLPVSASRILMSAKYPRYLKLAEKYKATNLGTMRAPTFTPFEFVNTFHNPTLFQLPIPGKHLVLATFTFPKQPLGATIEAAMGYGSWVGKSQYPGTWIFSAGSHGATDITWKLRALAMNIWGPFYANHPFTLRFSVPVGKGTVIPLNNITKEATLYSMGERATTP